MIKSMFNKFGDKPVEKTGNTANGVLTKMFRKIIFDTGLVRSLMYFIDKYKAEGGERAKTSIVKTITDSEMTWKYFIFLLFEVLRAKKVTFKIEVEWANEKITTHELEIEPIKTPKRVKPETRGRKPKYDQNKINEMLGVVTEEKKAENTKEQKVEDENTTTKADTEKAK